MENLIKVMEFVIELSVPTAATTLITVVISILVLRSGDLYKQKAWLFGLPVGIAIVVGATGPDDHTNIGQWAYYVLPTIALSLLIITSFFRKRLRQSKA